VEAPGVNCADGGQRLDVGLDDNNDGTLQAGEIDFTYYVCDGADGAAGLDGLNSLAVSTVEAPGVNCTDGGQRIDVGLDDNNDGTLQAGEIDNTYYICDGAPGPSSLQAAYDGGQTISMGSGNIDFTSGAANSILYIEEPNERVGIGINIPTQKLDVAGGNINVDASHSYLQGGAHLISQIATDQNVFIGFNTDGVTGANNTLVGYDAGNSLAGGGNNTLMGYRAGQLLGGGSWNTMIGKDAGNFSFGTNSNTFIGEQSGGSNSTGNQNTFVGRNTGLSLSSGDDNTAIGFNADVADGLSNATAIGANAVVGAPNSLVLGNGVNVGIGTSTPANRLEVAGDAAKFDSVIIANNAQAGYVLTAADATGAASWQPAAGGGSLQSAYDGGQTIDMTSGDIDIQSSGGSNLLYLNDATERVGIGTITPGASLEVVATGETAINAITDGGAVGRFAISGINTGVDDVAGYFVASNPAGGVDHHGIYSASEGSGSGIYAASQGSGTGSAAIFNNFNGGNSSPVVRIINTGGSASPSLTTVGAVGIGTSTPVSLLTVEDNATTGENVAEFINTATGDDDGAAIYASSISTNPNFGYGIIAEGNYVGVEAASDLLGLAAIRAQSNGADYGIEVLGDPSTISGIRVDANGAPYAGLFENGVLGVTGDVGGGGFVYAEIDNINPDGYTSLDFVNDLGNRMEFRYDGSNVGTIFGIWDDNDAAYRLVVDDATGNVGIGTSSPSNLFEVVGDAAKFDSVIIVNGAQAGYVLTAADATGAASWEPNPTSPWLINGNDLYYESGNIGIGHTTPISMLDLDSGNIQLDIEYSLLANDPTDVLVYQTKSVPHYSLGWYLDQSTPGLAQAWMSGFAGIKFFTNGNPSMAISQFGNVGIGTDLPGERFHVEGVDGAFFVNPYFGVASGTTLLAQLNSNSLAGGQLRFGRSDGLYTDVGMDGSGNFVIENQFDQSSLVVTQTQRVGIGTTNPFQTLHVASEGLGGNANMILEGHSASSTRGPGIDIRRSKGIIAAPATVASGDFLGAINFNGYGASNFQLSAGIEAFAEGTIAGTSVPARLAFSTTSQGASFPTEKMTIRSDGNVGIGITNPSNLLSVRESNPGGLTAIIANESAGGTSSVGGTKAMRISMTDNAGAGQKTGLEVQTSGTGTNQENAIFAQASGALTGGNNRGVVAGASNNTSSNVGVDAFASGNTGINYGVRSNVGGTHLSNKYAFYGIAGGNGTKYGMYMTGEDRNYFSGNVGIGTTNPQNELDVRGGMVIGSIYAGNTTAPTNGLAVQGNVGIGTNTMIGAAAFTISQPTAGFGGMYVNTNDLGEPFYGYATNGTTIRAYHYIDGSDGYKWKLYNGGVRMTVTTAGNVGIGTTSPTFALQVERSNAFGTIASIENPSTGISADGLNIALGGTAGSNDYIYFERFGGGVQGRIAAAGVGSVAYLTSSDRRLKKDISDFNGGLEMVLQMQPRHYVFKGSPDIPRVGFIAQELDDIFPEAVNGDENGDPDTEPMMVDYSKLTPILTSSVQELHAIILKQEKQINDLNAEVEKLKSAGQKNDQLENEVSSLQMKTNELEAKLQQVIDLMGTEVRKD
jgi:hypothetical protein